MRGVCAPRVQILGCILRMDPGSLIYGQQYGVIQDRCLAIEGGGGGRAKVLHEFLVQVLQLSHLDGPVARLTGAATAPGTQLARRLACPANPETFGIPGASVRIGCTGTSARTAVPSWRGLLGRACYTISGWRGTSRI